MTALTFRRTGAFGALAALGLVAMIVVPGAKIAGGGESRPPSTFRMPRSLEETLENGLRVIICPRPGASLVDVRVAVRVGAWLEGDRGGSGISHYYEHLVADAATATRTEKESQELLRSIGGIMNGRTDADRTWFWITTTPDGCETAIDLLADWLANAQLSEEEVTREKSVIERERAIYADQDLRVAWELLHATAFLRHPARFPFLGFPDRFARITRDDLVQFYARNYVPGNAVVAIVGDVDPAAAIGWARQAFAGWARKPRQEVAIAPEPPQQGRREARAAGTGTRSSVCLGYRTVPLAHPHMVALDAVRYVVGSGQDARLNRAMRENEINGGVQVYSRTPVFGGGLLIVMGDAAPERIADFERIVADELGRLAREEVAADELARAKKRLQTDILFELEKVEGLSQALTRDYLQTGDSHRLEAYLRLVAELTASDVQAAAATCLVPERLSVAIVGAAEREPSGGASTGENAGVTGARSFQLQNGTEIRIEPTPGTSTAAVTLSFGAGPWVETDEQLGASAVLADLLLTAASPECDRQRRELEAEGAVVATGVDRLTLRVEARTLAGDLDDALGWTRAVVAGAGVSEEAFAAARRRVEARAQQRRAAFQSDAEDRIYRRAFADAGLGRPVEGTEASRAALSAPLVEAFARNVLCGRNLCVAIVGDVDADVVRARATELFQDLPAGEAVRRRPAAVTLTGGVEYVETERRQVTIVLAFPGAAVEEKARRVALDLGDAWSSGRMIPSGPFHQALRVDRDLVYYVSADHHPRPGVGLFFVVAQCAVESYAEVVTALREVVLRVRGGMTENELATAKNILGASRRSVTQTADARAMVLATAGSYGLESDAARRYEARVAEADLATANRVLEETFAGDGLLLVLWPEGIPKP